MFSRQQRRMRSHVIAMLMLLTTTHALVHDRPPSPPRMVTYPPPSAKARHDYWRREQQRHLQCEPINLRQCEGVRYNYTTLPNMFGYQRQRDAAVTLSGFQLLFETGCSTEIQLFVCLVLAPYCDASGRYGRPIGPCRNFCRRMVERCRGTVESFQYAWPEWLDCDQFPEKHEKGGPLCNDYHGEAGQRDDDDDDKNDSDVGEATSSTDGMEDDDDDAALAHRCKPTQFFVKSSNSCAWPCQIGDAEDGGSEWAGRFSDEQKRFAERWMTGWSLLCFLCTLFAVGTYFLDQSRFKYPERPVIFISLCYLIVSSAVFLRLVLGREQVSCDHAPDGTPFLIQDGLTNTGCTIVFLLSSYFITASYVWWVVLTCSWFFAAGLKWTQEAIGEKSAYFHSLAWGLPCLNTVLIMANRHVEGDELTGMCGVGNQDPVTLARYVVAPLCALLISGFMIVILGFVSLYRVRTYMQREGSSTVKLEKLMVKIVVFAGIFVAAATFMLGSYAYEISHQKLMERKLSESNTTNSVLMWNFYVRFALQLFTGAVAGGWVLSYKTIHSWRSCIKMVMVIVPDDDDDDDVKDGATDSLGWGPQPSTNPPGKKKKSGGSRSPPGGGDPRPLPGAAAYQQVTSSSGGALEQLSRPLLYPGGGGDRMFRP